MSIITWRNLKWLNVFSWEIRTWLVNRSYVVGRIIQGVRLMLILPTKPLHSILLTTASILPAKPTVTTWAFLFAFEPAQEFDPYHFSETGDSQVRSESSTTDSNLYHTYLYLRVPDKSGWVPKTAGLKTTIKLRGIVSWTDNSPIPASTSLATNELLSIAGWLVSAAALAFRHRLDSVDDNCWRYAHWS